MQRTTSQSLPLSPSISQPRGLPTILTCSCLFSCFQVNISLKEEHVSCKHVISEATLHRLFFFSANRNMIFKFWLYYSTVGLYYCFNNLSDARIFIIMYGVTSMYFSAVMVIFYNYNYWSITSHLENKVFVEKVDKKKEVKCKRFKCVYESITNILWGFGEFAKLFPCSLCERFLLSAGSTHVGPGPSHVHPLRDRRVSGAHNLHEKSGCEPTRQKVQEATRCHLSHQEWGVENVSHFRPILNELLDLLGYQVIL